MSSRSILLAALGLALAGAAAASDAPPKAQDPMERLRERLAEKLGASRPPEAASHVVRVTARGGDAAAASTAPARPAAPPAAAKAHAAPHWGYEGAGGPQHWARLKPEFAACANGRRQSPIDIRDGMKLQLDPVQFDYRASGFRVVDNGHTVQVEVEPGNAIEVMGRRYELQQFHFHRPAEERIAGRAFDMVAHLVHQDAEGRLAVVAVLLEQGSAHPLVQSVWNNLPLEQGDAVAAKGTIALESLLPAERGYFTYMGSLTTPPCSEGVLWMVMKQPVQLSAEQVGIFARLYPMNARPVQPLAGRRIKESE